MAIVQFDAADFLELFPQFVEQISEKQLEFAFQQACLLCDNSEDSPIPYDPENGVEVRKILLYWLVCHLATLALRPLNQSGPVTNATEGSVSVGFQVPSNRPGEWYKQTACGDAYWQYMRRFAVGGKYYPKHNYHPWG